MNQDDIMRMAREVGASEPESLFGRTDYIVMTRYELERFATVVYAAGAAAEREKCAKKCESYIATEIGKEMADAIRAMGNE
jgi:hypothetical protein